MRHLLAFFASLVLLVLLSGCGGGSVTPGSSQSSGPLRITTTSIGGAVAGVPYSARIAAQGGTAPYKWDTLEPLPQGFSVSQDGVLSGMRPLQLGGEPALNLNI